MFPTTRWTLILAARHDREATRKALEELFALYWKPVYFFLRRKGLDVAAAEDACQSFFLHLLEQDFLKRLDPARGRFRSYLLTALQHHLANLHEQASAQKRGGAFRFVPLDVALAERELPAAADAAASAFEREWAMGVMERAWSRLRGEYTDGNRKGNADTVARFFGFERAPSYAEAAAECGMSVPQFKASLHRARARFRALVKDEIAATVDGEHTADAELDELVRALSA